MKGLGDLAAKYNLLVQSDLDESVDEITRVKKIHPSHPDYISVYNAYGLLTNRSILAHVVYPTEDERQLIKRRGAGISHCLKSNLNLRSGVAKVRKLLNEGLKLMQHLS
ncbi:hypothetical protein K7432_010436 [Basidiobolus ranarum]|uniref:Amidohydrolase-related domain-containing protein n=1 Tax=Basidiobolus ranarum TaxID=34480 RepID=A0ABR2VVY4_9FUNG